MTPKKLPKAKTQLWYCPHCEKPFKTIGVAFTLTVKCPHCDKVQNIKELHAAARKLVYAGMSMWTRMTSLTDDIDPSDSEEQAFLERFGETKSIVKEIIARLAQDTEIEMYAHYNSEHVKDEREQDSYFEKNPNSNLRKGKTLPF
jgi:phage FluMu protein Com